MSETLLLAVDPAALDSSSARHSLQCAARILREGGTVAFPTETVYGLGGNALNAHAIERIFQAKQRPGWDPLIVHIADLTGLTEVVTEVSAVDRVLMEAFWPGALTLLMPRSERVPSAVTAGRAKVGIRMPSHPVARALLEAAGIPIAAPSANSFSKISPTTARHVLDDLAGRIDAIVDGGPASLGLESTVLDANASPSVIYRPGMISIEQLRGYLADVHFYVELASDNQHPEAAPSPGVGIRHYAPRAELILVDVARFEAAMRVAEQQPGTTGVLLPGGLALHTGSLQVYQWGKWDEPETLARTLYSGLRALDMQNVKRILCPLPAAGGLGVTLRDRLQKAARPRPTTETR